MTTVIGLQGGKVCNDLGIAVGEEGKILFLQSGDDLSALFVIDDGIDVNDLGADGDFLSFTVCQLNLAVRALPVVFHPVEQFH